ncbi:hypothetical protein GCM10023340_41530 [Nocardioides marinquilinus]|uniref:Oxidoreductase molybdopterin-binding domain-containing protein n=1 Tax=Nocardioides marinquilinus TaxID=1210400 RepID=A0ABP9Q2E3_9ACTN
MNVLELPPGQRAVEGFPRFGVDTRRPPPRAPDGAVVELTGPFARRVVLDGATLAGLPRREVEAAFHCVAGWSALGLRWEGVRVRDVWEQVVAPALVAEAEVRWLVLVGRDGYRSIVRLDDALADDVLLADRLDGAPLPPEHGAPLRLVSPGQYGYVNTKHLCRIELHRREPVAFLHPARAVQWALMAVRPHPRARVAHEERHRFVPGPVARRLYRLVRLPAARLRE